MPLITKEEWVKDLQGLSLKNVSITLVDNKGKKIYVILGNAFYAFWCFRSYNTSASRHILDYDYKGVKLIIDLKPALAEEKVR